MINKYRDSYMFSGDININKYIIRQIFILLKNVETYIEYLKGEDVFVSIDIIKLNIIFLC